MALTLGFRSPTPMTMTRRPRKNTGVLPRASIALPSVMRRPPLKTARQRDARPRQHAGVFPRPPRHRHRGGAPEAQRERHGGGALSGGRLAARCRLLLLLHGHQPRGAPGLGPRAAALCLARLALGLPAARW